MIKRLLIGITNLPSAKYFLSRFGKKTTIDYTILRNKDGCHHNDMVLTVKN
jgi:hypothetical protein